MSARRPRSRFARLALCVALSSQVTFIAAAQAHPLDESTARVTLRDAHLEVVIDCDLFLMVSSTPTEVATSTDESLRETHARLRRELEAGASLRVDGALAPLSVTGFIEPAELRAMAATLSASRETHGARARVRLESPRVYDSPRAVTLSGPASLGPLVVTFTQPSTRYAWPGRPASFDVLATRPRAAREEPAPATAAASTRPDPRDPRRWVTAMIALGGTIALASRRARDERRSA